MDLTPATLEELAAEPVGRYFAGATFLHFCFSFELWGVVLWGRPSADDMTSLVRSLMLELGSETPPHHSIVDARRLDSVDITAFGVLDGYVRENRSALATQISRLALIRPEGMAGAVVAGFFEVLPRPYPVEVFADLEETQQWLELSDPPSEEQLSAAHAQASGAPPIVTALRTLLDREHQTCSISDAARAMGMSDRTLQRRLRGAETTFVDELNLARVRAAKRLLRDSDAPVTTIALDVGCATPQHFSALFRRITGHTPSAWRARQTTKP